MRVVISLSSWDVSKVETMTGMFLCCREFSSDLSDWDVSKVSHYPYYIFNGCGQTEMEYGLLDHLPEDIEY